MSREASGGLRWQYWREKTSCLCPEVKAKYLCEALMAAARGESDLILEAWDGDRAGDVCMRVC